VILILILILILIIIEGNTSQVGADWFRI